MKIGWKPVLRDVGIYWLFTFLGGFLVGIAGSSGKAALITLGQANLLFGMAAFTLIGCKVKIDRFKHMFIVAVAAWITSLINIVVGPATVMNWLFGFLFIGASMLIGGGLSFLFVRTPSQNVQLGGNN